MGFLSLYEGTERVDVGNGYWVDVKRSVSAAEWQRLQNTLGATRQQLNVNAGTATANVDYAAYQQELVAMSVTAWNLDEDDGTVWAVKPDQALRRNIARLPSPVFIAVFQACDRLNGPRDPRDAASFPEGAGPGGEDRERGAAGAGVLPGPEGVLGAAGGGPGVPGPQAVA